MKSIQHPAIGRQSSSHTRRHNLCIAILGALSFIAGAPTCVANTNEVALKIREILHHVEAATITGPVHYASVHQTITASTPGPTNSTGGKSPTVLEEADYAVAFAVDGTHHATKRLGPVKSSGSAPLDAKVPTPASKVWSFTTVVPIEALRAIQGLNSASLEDDVYEGSLCYKLSASSAGRVEVTMWVNKTNWTVPRMVAALDAVPMYDAHFEYKEWNGHPAPLRTVITWPSDKAQVVQVYSGHTF
jgi:hypothetical protein